MGTVDRSDYRAVSPIERASADCVAEGIAPTVLFGGTFDPPHVGHLLMAQLTYEQVGADSVWFLPSPRPPHKMEQAVDDHRFRRKMVEALIQGRPHFAICDIEATLPQPSYTVDTIHACLERYPDRHFLFLIGADSLTALPTWERADELTQLVEFVVADRVGHEFSATFHPVKRVLPHLRARLLQMPMMDVSSTWLRHRIEMGFDTCGLLPDNVWSLWCQVHGS